MIKLSWIAAVAALGCLVLSGGGAAAVQYAPVVPERRLVFPEDYGSHPEFRVEWWYITGWLASGSGEPVGFQITFFRTKPDLDSANPSAFTPRELLIAHAALSDTKRGRLWQAQKIERAGLDLAAAAVGDTDVHIDRWSLKRAAGAYDAAVNGEDFSLSLRFGETQPILLNGGAGLSRKGPEMPASSYYYSVPHLQVSGTISRGHVTDRVVGSAWLDHEWSSEYLDSKAIGWDWIGINLNDGGAIMAFRIREAGGGTRWAGGTLRDTAGTSTFFTPADVTFVPQRTWRSTRTGVVYPVQWHVRLGTRELDLEPLMDDQENDTRFSTGAIYWEGAVRAFERRQPVGQGYLELTGYGDPLRLR